ncbi:GumC family protein [Pontibacter fetidus]|uniref:non-specific protein-tyrosine kinase n=1 Tax=Pontibacter fetidus TaxID=2700082 RepID=A0A6B2H5M0_9BACT|nr:tyrosine-protein kinase [Pontibacter fetidus]NDK55587.1 polysaccharide biosynthesis tyrosine autokinase [Pontibacter fetidus]
MSRSEDNFFNAITYRYFPYWPLFLGLIILSLAGAWAYLNFYKIPTYEVTASLLIKDERKGVNDAKMTESIDAFTTNKIVENEINVIHSHALVREVVDKLGLYAPIYEEDRFKAIPAYSTTPIRIKLKNPNKAEEVGKVYFTYNKATRRVTINGKQYVLDKWVKTPYGKMRFTANKQQVESPSNPLFFSIVSPKKITSSLLGRINIQASSRLSTVVDLTLSDQVPERGEDILNTLIKSYTQLAVSEKNVLAANTLQFVENRIKLVEKELLDLENEVVKYKANNGAVDLSSQSKLFLNNVGETDRKISEINTQLAVLDMVERYIISKNNRAGIVPSTLGISDPVLTQMLQKLYDSEIRYQQLSKTIGENNPILISLSKEIESIRPGILENIQNQRANLMASRSNLSSTSNSYSTALQHIPQKERELLEISRQQAIKNEAYSFLLQKREETVLSNAPSAGEVRIVDMAESSPVPSSPIPLYVYLIAVTVSTGLGFLFVIGKELMNSKLLFRSEIEQCTNAPIVAELSAGKPQQGRLFQAPTDISVVEQFRQLKATMGLYGRTSLKKKIMVTSSIPGEGKSFVSANLAYSLASAGKKVALLDFDLRNPSTSVQFDLREQTGIIDFLNDEICPEQIVKSTPFKNLYLVPAGLNSGDHTDLMVTEKLDTFFTYLEKEFDYIIIDTPPVELVSDVYLLSEYIDITLLVLRHAHTPKNIVQRLSQSSKFKCLSNVAIVFNGVKSRGFVKGQFGYGYGYGYENKYEDKTYRARNVAARM